MATLKTVFKADGVVTAANSSQITDGAAAVLIMERSVAEKLGYAADGALRRRLPSPRKIRF